jgi:hypothetical protein
MNHSKCFWLLVTQMKMTCETIVNQESGWLEQYAHLPAPQIVSVVDG